MGNLSCSKCVEELENRLETNLQNAVIKKQAILQAYSTLTETEFNSLGATGEIELFQSKNSPSNFFKIQLAWKAYKARKELKLLKSASLSSSYFTSSDVLQTISKRFYTNSRKKRKILYKNAGIYEGETKGGFRDGYGKMIWVDGCSYVGNWGFGYPEGYGKFIFSDKEAYEGKWINPFPYGKQSFSSSTKSFDGNNTVYHDGYSKK